MAHIFNRTSENLYNEFEKKVDYIYIYIYIYIRFMRLTNSLNELIEDHMLQYCWIVLNINNRT